MRRTRGHLAASLAVIELDNDGDDLSVDPTPAGLVLFNPATDLSLHIGRGYPPSIIFRGTADRIVPFVVAERFVEKLTRSGNDCTLYPFEGRGHGFFNLTRGERDFRETIAGAEAFLKKIGHWPATAL